MFAFLGTVVECVRAGRRKVGLGVCSWEPGTERTNWLRRGPKRDSGVLGAGSGGCLHPLGLSRSEAAKPSESREGEPAAGPRYRQPARSPAGRNSASCIARLPLRRPSQGGMRFRCKSFSQPPVCGLSGSPEPTGCSQGFRFTPAPGRIWESGYYLPLASLASRQTLQPVSVL